MLENLKVLELASVLAGPSVGQFFAELGAEVIKVESINGGGDVTRSWKLSSETADNDRSAYFCSVNWGKMSVALDLQTSDGREKLYKLVEKADIVIGSYKPGDSEKLGVSYDQLKKYNNKLIYGQISGYGSHDERVGYDAVIQAESGFMDMNGEALGEPLKMPVALIDVLAAHHLKEGLLLALLRKEKTGEGSLIEVSLIQAAISSLANQASNWLVAKSLPKRKGSLHPNIAPYGEVFKTKDKKNLVLAVGNDKQFRNLCALLNLKAIPLDKKYLSNQSRVENRIHLKDILEKEIAKYPANELMELIHAKKIPAGLIQDVEEVFTMKEAEDILINAGGLSGVRNLVTKENGKWLSNKQLSPPPKLGEHNHIVFREK